jgi:tetratricopeptide (TPR) repeat protein
MVVVAVAALGIGAWLLWRGAGPAPGSGAPSPPTSSAVSSRSVLPDPDTSSMTAPVARAIRQARQVALARPGSAAAAGRLGQVLHAHWLYDAAAASYGIARELAPRDFRWVYLLAGVEDVRGADGARIDQLFREAIRLAPDFPPVYVRHADALLRLGRWSEAGDAYQAAIERDPGLVLAHRGLGQAATLLGNGPAAVEHLERAAALDPRDRITQVALARAYTLVGRADQAAGAAREAQTLDSQASLPDPVFFEVERLAVDPETLRKRVARGLRNNDYDMAIEAVTLLEESGAPGARRQLALASKQRANRLAFSGEFDGALAEFGRAARLAPTDPEIEHNWGTVLLRRGDLEEAGRHFQKAIEINPRSADSRYNLGVVLEGLGRSEEAIAQFKAAVAIDPRHAAAERLAEPGAASLP